MLTEKQQKKLERLEGDVLDSIRENLGDRDGDERIAQMDSGELLERYLTWHGIIGYGEQIREAVSVIDDATRNS